MTTKRRKVVLRDIRQGADWRNLWAYVDEHGKLHIDGQDLGPGTWMVSSDGEYEWFRTIAADDVPRLVALLGGTPDDDVLDLLERDWTGDGSYRLETLLRDNAFPSQLTVW